MVKNFNISYILQKCFRLSLQGSIVVDWTQWLVSDTDSTIMSEYIHEIPEECESMGCHLCQNFLI